MSKVSEPLSNRQQRQLSYISEFTTDIQHIQGKDNPVADSLSRATLDSVQLGIDYSVMAADQKDDPELQAYLTTPTSLLFKEVPFGQQGITLLCDTSTGQARPVVPVSWRRKVFDLIHDLSHPSIRATRKLISSKFIWKGMNSQVGSWAKTCIQCQSSKIHTHIKSPLETFNVPHRRFDHIHVDLVGPLPPSDGFTHLLTMWTVSPVGRKQSLSMTYLPLPVLGPSYTIGSHVLGFPWTCPQTGDPNSLHSYGHPLPSC